METKTILLGMGLIGAVWIFGMAVLFANAGGNGGGDVTEGIPDSGNGPTGNGNGTGAGVQEIYIHAKNDGTYDKDRITVKAGTPVRLHFSADKDAGCGRALVVYGLNVQAVSKNGQEQIVTFTPKKTGTFEYNCGMRMWQGGALVVTA